MGRQAERLHRRLGDNAIHPGVLEIRAARPDVGHVSTSPDPPPVPPEKPLPTDCCGSGCSTCVLDSYQEELDAYEARLAAWRARHAKGGDAGAE